MKAINSNASNAKTWLKTPVQNLVRHKSGTYYARVWLLGKEKWRSLKTKNFTIAQFSLKEITRGNAEIRKLSKKEQLGTLSFGDALNIHISKMGRSINFISKAVCSPPKLRTA